MPDVVAPEVRSRMMRGIKGKDTKPELMLRSGLHRNGFRFKLNSKELPGKPDLVFPRYKSVVFAHGCLWHRHDCHLFKWPCLDNATKSKFWRDKINCNVDRDVRQIDELKAADWRVAIVWECALKGKTRLNIEDVLSQLMQWLVSENDIQLEIAGR